MRDDDFTRFLSAYDGLLRRWPVPYQQLDLASRYGTTRVIACGPPRGQPLVLMHGAGATATVWFANVAGLSRTRRVYAIDRIGEAGRSTPGELRVRSAGDLLRWLVGVLDGLGAGRADLCGHSYGGWLALSCAMHAPARVRRVVLLDPTQCFGGFRPGYLLRAGPLLLCPTSERARRFLAWETRGAPMDPAWLELYGRAAAVPHPGIVRVRRPRARRLRGLASPVLVLLAADARAHNARRVAAAARRRLPHAEVAVLPGLTHHGLPYGTAGHPLPDGSAGHPLPDGSAADINRRILRFLGEPGLMAGHAA